MASTNASALAWVSANSGLFQYDCANANRGIHVVPLRRNMFVGNLKIPLLSRQHGLRARKKQALPVAQNDLIERIVIIVDPPLFGRTKPPTNVAPRASEITSPGWALLIAACRSPPADTVIVDAVEIDAQRQTPAHTPRAVRNFFISILVDQIGGARAAAAALTDLPRRQ